MDAPPVLQEGEPILAAASVGGATSPPVADAAAPRLPRKSIHSLVLDAGPLIKNDPAVSTLISQAEELYTIPSVISEIRDAATRSRLETTLRPFLRLRNPRPDSVKFCTAFARKTGDLEVLSKPDIHLIALTYELELERNGGDWRLRRDPAQKGLNGRPPGRDTVENDTEKEKTSAEDVSQDGAAQLSRPAGGSPPLMPSEDGEVLIVTQDGKDPRTTSECIERAGESEGSTQEKEAEEALRALNLEEHAVGVEAISDAAEVSADVAASDEDDDSDGWITPSNLHKHQARDSAGQTPSSQPSQRTLQAALLTSDFAMQNVAMRINLNLVSPALCQITRVKSWVLRCHGCFRLSRDMARRFCPSCGQATLTRVSCSTESATGQLRLHLKRNFQLNKRGNVYSIPKPVHGSASGKFAAGSGGGKNGWGRELILAEDQKEYTRKVEEEHRTRYRDLMDEDYLPSILSGERSGGGGKIRIGAGRNVNSKRRK